MKTSVALQISWLEKSKKKKRKHKPSCLGRCLAPMINPVGTSKTENRGNGNNGAWYPGKEELKTVAPI